MPEASTWRLPPQSHLVRKPDAKRHPCTCSPWPWVPNWLFSSLPPLSNLPLQSWDSFSQPSEVSLKPFSPTEDLDWFQLGFRHLLCTLQPAAPVLLVVQSQCSLVAPLVLIFTPAACVPDPQVLTCNWCLFEVPPTSITWHWAQLPLHPANRDAGGAVPTLVRRPVLAQTLGNWTWEPLTYLYCYWPVYSQ